MGKVGSAQLHHGNAQGDVFSFIYFSLYPCVAAMFARSCVCEYQRLPDDLEGFAS